TYLPFGSGVRRCVGDRMAMMQIRELLSAWLSRVEFETIASKPAKVRRRAVQYVPHDGVLVAIEHVHDACDTQGCAVRTGMEANHGASRDAVQSLLENTAGRTGVGSS
ncbi:MAG: cytochrome P450, partial [Solirubrobacterales bacterium]